MNMFPHYFGVENKFVSTVCAVLILVLSSFSNSASAADCNDYCFRELIKAVDGGTANTAGVRAICGSDAKIGRPALDVFKGPGIPSLNIPVTCHAALYQEENTPALRTWFEDYFDIQERPLGPTGAGFMGTEILSPLYGPLTAGALTSVLDRARALGHSGVVGRAERWLRAYYGFSALVARNGNVTSHRWITRSGTSTGNGNASFFTGITSSAAGSRTRAHTGPVSTAHSLLTLAADRTPRRYTHSVNNSPGFYGGLKVFALTAGYSVNSGGQISNFASRTAPLSKVGITQAQRNALRELPTGAWQSHLSTVMGMVGTYRPTCEMTFMRTTQGLISWFGTSQSPQNICNRGKGPFFAVRIDNNGTAHYLAPATETSPPPTWRSYRDGQRICAANDTIPGGPWCLDLPGGEVLYELAWTRAEGLRKVSGSGGGGGNEPTLRVQADFVGPIQANGSLDFGATTQAPGLYLERVIRMINDGAAPMTLSATVTNTAGSSFVQVGQPASPEAPGSNTSVFRLRFRRDFIGSHLRATVRISHNATNTPSPFTFTVTGTVAGGEESVTLLANADAYVAFETPGINFGGSSVLRLRDGVTGLTRRSFLRFQVPSYVTNITSAKLVLRAVTPISNAGIYRMNSLTWSEFGLNWSNHLAPPASFTFLRSVNNLSAGAWHEIDVTNGLLGAGPITFGIASPVNIDQSFRSRESVDKPRLVISYQP